MISTGSQQNHDDRHTEQNRHEMEHALN